jgi:LacI family transcriptional regulator
MGKTVRIAVATELSWPLKRHYGILAGIQEYAETQDNWVVEVKRYPEVHMANGIHYDGIAGRITNETLAAAKAAGTPVVNSWISSPVADQVPCVQPDMAEAGRLAAKHLLARGFKRLAHVGFTRRRAPEVHFSGMREVAREAGVPFSRHFISPNFELNAKVWARTVSDVQKFIDSWQSPIGVVCYSADLARALVAIMQENGWQVPEQAALVTSGNSEILCNAVAPTLSTVDMGHQRVGFEAAKLLHHLIDGGKPPAEPIMSPPKQLVVRRSSDVYAVRDPKVAAALHFMAENSHRQIAVPDIAAAAELGRQSLERRFREQIGTTINNELIRLRIERLKRLLVETDSPVREVGEQAGFGTVVNMHNTFKRLVGMTPASYREAHSSPTRW